VYNAWASAADSWGPVTEYLSADKTICNQGDIVTIVANVHDWTTGGSNVGAAQYRVDNGTGVAMQTFDGSFNSPAEAVVSSTTPLDTTSLSPGWHWIEVRGQDAALNWGAWVGIAIYVNPPVVPYATATGPTGTSNDNTPTVAYDYGNGPTSITVYYTTNGGTSWSAGVADTTIDGTYTFGALAAGTYNWNVRANGEAAPSGAGSIEAGPYVLDLTAPNPPTGLTVDQYGMVSAPATHTYTFSGVTAAGGPHDAYFDDLDDQTQAELETPNSRLELTDAQYANIVTSDDVWGGIATDSGLNDEYGIEYRYLISEAQGTITSIDITHEGYWTQNAQTVTLYARDDAGIWTAIGTTMAFTAGVDGTMTRTISTTPANYVDASGVLRVMFAGSARSNAGVYIDYATITVYYTGTGPGTGDNTLNWTASTSPDVDHYNIYRSDAEFGTYSLIGSAPVGTNTYEDNDHGTADATLWWYRVRAVDTATNEETNTNAVRENNPPSNPPYDIVLTGRAANSWAFISFPSGLTGNVQTILDDTVLGDSGTTWDVVKWFNPLTPSDPWKTYRVGGTANDMPSINNTMGFWIHLTANGGDQELTLNAYAATPATTNIVLQAGWNLVGYPSSTATTGATLPAAVDMLSVYSGSATYTDYVGAAMDPIAISHGNAYFMHATATAPWTVNNP
jgi:hypothetical protein